MKSLVISTLFIFFSICSFSSDKVHFISLEKESIHIPNFGFQLIQVINATGETNKIGFVEKTISYKDVPAFFNRDIGEEISLFLSKNLQQTSGDLQLIVRVNELDISESYNGVHEKAIAKVSLTFIYKKGDSCTEKFSVVKQAVKMSSMGITKSQPEVIAKALTSCFEDFYERAMENKLIDISISDEDLLKRPDDGQKLIAAYLAADRSRKALYRTFLDFQSNTPDFDRDFKLAYKTKSSGDESVIIKYARISDAKTGEKINDIWGFTDGQVVYTLIGKKYLPLQKDEESFYLELKVQDQNTMTTAAIAGGLIGSTIAYATAPITKVRLDYFTGTFDFSGQSLDDIEKAKQALINVKFFSSTFNSKSSYLELYINDTLRCTLKRETWYKFTASKAGDTLHIVLKSANQACTAQDIIVRAGKEDIYLCIDKKKKSPVINRVQSNSLSETKSLMTPENMIYDVID